MRCYMLTTNSLSSLKNLTFAFRGPLKIPLRFSPQTQSHPKQETHSVSNVYFLFTCAGGAGDEDADANLYEDGDDVDDAAGGLDAEFAEGVASRGVCLV